MRRLLSTTRAAMLVCVFGCGLLFFPWAHRGVLPVDPTLQAKGIYKATGDPAYMESFPGYAHWQGTGCAAAFFGVLVFLVISSSLEPVPWWRSAAVMAGGVGIMGTVLFTMRYWPGDLGPELPLGRLGFNASFGVATYVALGLAVALVLLASLELRSSIASRCDRKLGGEPMSEPNSAEPGAAADGGRDLSFSERTVSQRGRRC